MSRKRSMSQSSMLYSVTVPPLSALINTWPLDDDDDDDVARGGATQGATGREAEGGAGRRYVSN